MSRKRVTPLAGENEADIVQEVGAEPADPNEPTGPLEADEDKVREVGAVDAESVRANRRVQETINQKRAGVKKVAFNDPNVLLRYEDIGKFWPLNTIAIFVKRLTGTPAQDVITSQPRNSTELLAAIKALHGRREETTYELIFRDITSQERRGGGQITIPSTLDQVPMNQYPPPPPPPYGYQPQPVYPQPQPGYVPPQPPPNAPPVAAAAAPQPQQPPVVQVMQPPQQQTDLNQMFEFFKQMWQMTHQSQPQQPQMPAPDPQAQMSQMFDMFRQWQASMQPPQEQPPQGRRQQPTPPQYMPSVNPMMMGMMGMPPVQPPPGTVFVPGFGFVPVQKLAEAVSPQTQPSPPPYRTPMYGRPSYEGAPPSYGRPSYDGPPPPHYAAQQQQQRPQSALDQFREATGVLRFAKQMVEEFSGEQPATSAPAAPEAEDHPYGVMDVAGNKVLYNKEDGSVRTLESAFANSDKILKFLGDTVEKLQKNAVKNEDPPPQKLPPGYVEVTPGYQPPPGYVAVPVDQIPQNAQQSLPTPPTNLPPPITAPQEGIKGWGTMPGGQQ